VCGCEIMFDRGVHLSQKKFKRPIEFDRNTTGAGLVNSKVMLVCAYDEGEDAEKGEEEKRKRMKKSVYYRKIKNKLKKRL